MSNIGRQVVISAKQGTVVGEETGKRGKTLIIVKMADGREIKADSKIGVQYLDQPMFAPAASMNEIMADVRRDYQARRREGIYYQNRALADR